VIEVKNLPLPLRKEGIEEKLAKICQENNVIFLAIFGSFIKGEPKKKSDIDIAIEFDKNKGKSLLDLVHIEYELTKIFKRKVDLGIFSSISPYIIEDVKREMRIIYEKRVMNEESGDEF